MRAKRRRSRRERGRGRGGIDGPISKGKRMMTMTIIGGTFSDQVYDCNHFLDTAYSLHLYHLYCSPLLNLPHLSEEPDDISLSDHSRPSALLELPSDTSGRSRETFVTARTSFSTLASTPQDERLSAPPRSSPTPAQTIVHQTLQSQSQSQSAQLSPPFPHRARRHGTRARSRSRSRSRAGPTQAPWFVQDDRTVLKRDLMLCKREMRDVQGRLTAYDDDEEKKMKRKSIGWREFEIVCRGGVVEFWRVSVSREFKLDGGQLYLVSR